MPVLGPGVLRDSLPYLLPVIVARLASNPVAEEGEELRLQLLQLLQLLLERTSGEPLAPHLPELVEVLSASYADAFPDSKKAACALTKAVAEQLPTYIEPHCAALVKALDEPYVAAELGFRAPPTPGKYPVRVHVISTSVIGVDLTVEAEFTVVEDDLPPLQ